MSSGAAASSGGTGAAADTSVQAPPCQDDIQVAEPVDDTLPPGSSRCWACLKVMTPDDKALASHRKHAGLCVWSASIS
jgi:hypothetical protein